MASVPHAMEAAGIKADSVIAKRVDDVASRLRRRQLVGSHAVAQEVVRVLREVVAASRAPSFEALVQLIEETGVRLADAGTKEPVIQNMVLRIIKFLKEEYQTALSRAMSSQFPAGTGEDILNALNGNPQTPFSTVSSPYPIIPQDTSASFTAAGPSGAPHLTRQDTHFPFDASRAPSRSDSLDEFASAAANAGGDTSAESTQTRQQHFATSSQTAMQPIATSSIFELLGHDPESNRSHAASMSSSFYSSATGRSTPIVASELQSPIIPSSPNADTNHNSLYRSQSKSQLFTIHRESLARFQTPSMTSLAPMLKRAMSQFEDEFSRKSNDLKPLFTDAIGELADEIGMVRAQIAEQAMEHIHSAEIILTLGHSRTVEDFLKAAARKRKITVVVAETAPFYHGRQLAISLSNANIPTLLVPDSAIFSLMSRISKVILGTHIVQADGSLIAITGSLPVCKVAKAHNVPVIVCTGMFKVSNMFMFAGAAGEMGDSLLMEMDNAGPAEVLCGTRSGFAGGDEEGDQQGDDLSHKDDDLIRAGGKGFEVVAPYWDRVPQDFVSLFITNIGAHPPSMIFRLLKELFE